MAPLVVLVGAFLTLAAAGAVQPGWALSLGVRGRMALAVMFVFTGVSHFVLTAEMVAMVPTFLPTRLALVYFTGVLEIAAAIALVVAPRPRWVGWALVAFLVILFPANVYSAVNRVGAGGYGPGYLWFRAPLQLLFIWWAWFFTREERR